MSPRIERRPLTGPLATPLLKSIYQQAGLTPILLDCLGMNARLSPHVLLIDFLDLPAFSVLNKLTSNGSEFNC